MRFVSIQILALSFLVSVLGGCEPHFVGDRPLDLQVIHGPQRLRIVDLSGTSYLAVLNADSRLKSASGSLQFYSLSDPNNPSLVESLSLETPRNASDFVIDGSQLFLADRNVNKVLVYDWTGSKFEKRIDSATQEQTSVKVTQNPQRLVLFTRPADNLRLLAVVCQSSGIIHFIRTDTLALVNSGSTSGSSADLALSRTAVGANIQMIARKKTVVTDGVSEVVTEHLGLSGSQKLGYGINGAVFLKVGSFSSVVTASYLAMGLFGYRLDTFQNNANLAWDLANARNGVTVNNVKYPGSEENGFRGLTLDASGNIYATSRADNGLYRIPATEFQAAKEAAEGESTAKRNTTGFDKNSANHRILVLDTNTTDELFPRLGEVQVNYCPDITGSLPAGCSSSDATVGWVLGVGEKDGDEVKVPGRVYRIDLSASPVAVSHQTADTALGDSPQALLWYPQAGLLYVGNMLSNSISVLRDDNLTLVTTVNP